MNFFKKSSKFFEKCSESFDSYRRLKISKSIFSHTKQVKTLVKIFKNGFFQKSSKFFGKCSESSDSFRKLKVSIYFFQYKMSHNTYKFQKLNFQKIPGNRGIHNSGYWKIAGLTACHFQGNSWKLGASIIQVIGKQQAQRPAIFRGTHGNWGYQ